MSITDRVNQLIVINYSGQKPNIEDLTLEPGGIMMEGINKETLLRIVLELKNNMEVMPVVVGSIGSDLGIDLEDAEPLVSRVVSDNLQDPHLFYAT